MVFGVLGRCDLGRESRLLAKCDHTATLEYTKKNIQKLFVVVFLTEVLAFWVDILSIVAWNVVH